MPNQPHPIEKWFTGKALQIILNYVLPTLAEAEKQGFWPTGASRKVKAALNKQNVAQKFARKNERSRTEAYHGPMGGYPDPATLFGMLDDVQAERKTNHYFSAGRASGHGFVFAMQYGQFESAPSLLEIAPSLKQYCINDEERKALATARQWAADFTPIAELVEKLDVTRPLPTFIMKTLSPTVFKNLSESLGVDFSSIRLPDFETKWVDMTIAGKKVCVPVSIIIWPEGTLHNKSRYCVSKNNNDQCQACGHAIKSNNWVPLLAERSGKPPISLWVGRDCARSLFGVEMKGEGSFQKEGK
jgi:hypothetical protein